VGLFDLGAGRHVGGEKRQGGGGWWREFAPGRQRHEKGGGSPAQIRRSGQPQHARQPTSWSSPGEGARRSVGGGRRLRRRRGGLLRLLLGFGAVGGGTVRGLRVGRRPLALGAGIGHVVARTLEDD